MATTSVTNDTATVTSVLESSKVSSSNQNSTSKANSTLDKDAFLKLFVTQLNNQDPTEPMDTSEMTSQLAQYSTVEQLQNLNTSVDTASTSYNSTQAIRASSLVGTTVLAPASSASVDTSSGLTGNVVLTESSSDTKVAVHDSNGNLVRTLDLGSQSSGTSSFTWDGKDEAGNTLPSGTYSFSATGVQGGTETAATTYLPSTVNSVTLGTGGDDMTLNLSNGSSVALSEVKSVG